jgi:LysM repeat protein
LSAIAAQHGVTVAALMQINNISDPNFIYVGQRIRLS